MLCVMLTVNPIIASIVHCTASARGYDADAELLQDCAIRIMPFGLSNADKVIDAIAAAFDQYEPFTWLQRDADDSHSR